MTSSEFTEPSPLDREMIISDFNECWMAWFESLKAQMPEIEFELQNGITLLSAANVYDFEKLMFNFQWYTMNSLDKLLRNDATFLDDMVEKARQSKVQLMPDAFKKCFDTLDGNQQKVIWGTLKRFAKDTCSVYPEYHAEMTKAIKNYNSSLSSNQ